MANKFFWYDILTTDVAGAAKFYSDVIGWNAKDSGIPGSDYTLFSIGDYGVAGLMATPEQALKKNVPPMWNGYVYVDDVDAYAEKIQNAGGRIHIPPSDIPQVGRFAVVADMDGASFEIMCPKGDRSAQQPPAAKSPGTIGWHELFTEDVDRAFAFYSNLFGWTKGEAMDMGPMGVYQIFHTDGEMAGGMMKKPAEMPYASWTYYFYVDSAAAAAERVKAGGGKVMRAPDEVPGGEWAGHCMDPQGAVFGIVSVGR